MILNPELRRHIWLELNLQKLILTPLVIGALVWLSDFGRSLAPHSAYGIALFYLFLWGTKSAAEAIPHELNHHTWDYQRLSTMSPWTLAWGKLLGSTLYAWYGALIALTFYTFITLKTQSPYIVTPYMVIAELMTLLLGGLLAHSAALFLSMTALQWEKPPKVNTLVYLIFGLWVACWPTYHALHSIEHYNILNERVYGIPISNFTFYFGSLCLFLFWSLLGIYRSMRSALQYPNIPWVWSLFMLFCVFYSVAFFQTNIINATFPPQSEGMPVVINLALFLPRYVTFSNVTLLTYAVLFFERIDIITYKKLLYKTQKARHFPKWIISLMVTIAVGIWAGSLPVSSLTGVNHEKWVIIPALFSTSCILFLIRDILIIHYFKFSKSTNQRNITILLYLAILHILLPALLAISSIPNEFLMLFQPIFLQDRGFSLAAPILEIVLMAWLVRKQWLGQPTQPISTSSI